MRTLVSLFVTIALGASCWQVRAETPCPELTRLRSKAVEAAKRTFGASMSERCEATVRLSMAWEDVTEYARDHRESCEISQASLADMEKRHREAVQERKEVCAGRPARVFPPEIR
jgi:hypothetical protein